MKEEEHRCEGIYSDDIYESILEAKLKKHRKQIDQARQEGRRELAGEILDMKCRPDPNVFLDEIMSYCQQELEASKEG